MSETIKAKTTQRLSNRRRVSCSLRVSLSSLRDTIVSLLLLLLAVLADASYPSVLPPKPLFVPNIEKKTKRGIPWNYGLSSSSPHSHLKGSCRTSRCPSYEAFADRSSLMQTAPYAEFSYVSTTRSIRDRTHL